MINILHEIDPQIDCEVEHLCLIQFLNNFPSLCSVCVGVLSCEFKIIMRGEGSFIRQSKLASHLKKGIF